MSNLIVAFRRFANEPKISFTTVESSGKKVTWQIDKGKENNLELQVLKTVATTITVFPYMKSQNSVKIY
jgi:hypothetical protein